MARNANKNRIFRYNRRIRGQTDYQLRLRLLKSGLSRAVVRRTNKNMIVQIVNYNDNGDHIITSARSADLTKLGYTLNTGNISAAYLTGLLAGKRALKAGIKGEVIVDFGLQYVHYQSRLFAAVKGLIDSGLKVKSGDSVFPPEERLNGTHLKAKDASKIIEKTIKAIEGGSK